MMLSLLWGLTACTRGTADSGELDVPGDLLAVSESSSGRILFMSPETGRFRGEVCLSELLPEECPPEADADETNQCLAFAFEHALIDGDSTFQLTYSRRNPDVPHSPAGIVSLRPHHPSTVRWKLDTLSFPEGTAEAEMCDPSKEADSLPVDCFLNGTHIILEDEDGTLVAADTNNSRVLWISPEDGSATGEVTAILDNTHADWEGWQNVNHIQLLQEGARTLLLTTFKASWTSEDGLSDRGKLVMWDVTDRTAPAVLWAWPEDGYLAAVHHGIVQDTEQGTLLLYGHSLGASDDPDQGLHGSVGFATYNGPDEPPTYLADGILPTEENPLGFVREAEVFSPGDWLLITDSGCENPSAKCTLPGRLLSVQLPSLSPGGQGGGLGDQNFIPLEIIPDTRRHRLTFPYEADLFYMDEVDAALMEGIGSCTDRDGDATDTADDTTK